MIRLIIGLCTASHDPENRRHRPFSWSKDGAGQQDFHMLPHGARKDRGKTPMTLLKAIGKESMAVLSVEVHTWFHCRSILTQIVINGQSRAKSLSEKSSWIV